MREAQIKVTEDVIKSLREKLDMTSLTFELERVNLKNHAPKSK